MHREQHKCRLRQPPEMMPPPMTEPDYSTFSSNLRAAGLNLLPHLIYTAVADACRRKPSKRNGAQTVRPDDLGQKSNRATRRRHETIH